MTSPVARRARLEIACFTPESAIKAADFGADRIELCADKDVGGVTPCKWIDVETESSRNSLYRVFGLAVQFINSSNIYQ